MLIRRTLLIGSLVTLFAAPASSQEPTLVVENGRVIVRDGMVLERGTVEVETRRCTRRGKM